MRKTTLVGVALGALALGGCTSVVQGHNQGLAAGGITPQTLPTGLPTGLPSESESPTPDDSGSPTDSGTPPPSGETFNLDIHQTLALSNDRGMRANVKINSVKYSLTPLASYGEKSENGNFVVVDVTLTVTAGTLPVNPLYFAYQAPNKHTYHNDDGSAIFAGFEPGLHADDLNAGGTVRGNVTFDVPLPRGATLGYEDPLGKIVGSWKLS